MTQATTDQVTEVDVAMKRGRSEEVAKKYGIDPAKLAERMRNLSRIKAKEGLVVDIDIGKWTAQAKLREEDLGIEISLEERRFVSLGHQKLFPPEIVNQAARAEAKGRDALERLSFLSADGRFVPITAWEEWKAANEGAKKAFFAVRDEIRGRYDAILVDVQKEYVKRAESVYDRLEALAGKAPKEGKADWVAGYVTRLLGRIPKKEDILARFYWEEKYRYLRMPSEIEEELLRTEKLRRERDLLHYENDDRREKVEAMNRAVVDQLKKEKEKIVQEQADFLTKTMLQQRQAIVEATAAAAAAIAKNRGKVLGSTVKALRNLVQKGRLLNFFDDPEVEQALSEIAGFLGREPARRSARKFGQTVSAIKSAMETSVRALESAATKDEEVARIVGLDLVESVRTIE